MLYGTHNRLFKIATPTHPLAYFEIIAIDPAAKRAANAPAKRWFDMDDAALQAAVASEPRLVHFVANTDDIQAARAALAAQGIERGPAVHPAAIRGGACCNGRSRCGETGSACLTARCPR